VDRGGRQPSASEALSARIAPLQALEAGVGRAVPSRRCFEAHRDSARPGAPDVQGRTVASAGHLRRAAHDPSCSLEHRPSVVLHGRRAQARADDWSSTLGESVKKQRRRHEDGRRSRPTPHGVDCFVMILHRPRRSTRTSVMGADQAGWAEKFTCRRCRSARRPASPRWRFGNVLGSAGLGWLPILSAEQIAKGGPVHGDAPRDAPLLHDPFPRGVAASVLQAGAMGRGGREILRARHGAEPVKIADLARDLITLSGASSPDVRTSRFSSGGGCARAEKAVSKELSTHDENADKDAAPEDLPSAWLSPRPARRRGSPKEIGAPGSNRPLGGAGPHRGAREVAGCWCPSLQRDRRPPAPVAAPTLRSFPLRAAVGPWWAERLQPSALQDEAQQPAAPAINRQRVCCTPGRGDLVPPLIADCRR